MNINNNKSIIRILGEVDGLNYEGFELLKVKENQKLEFKESFGWASLAKYLKTCAAFSNAKGGIIIFGITDIPHCKKGLNGKALESFRAIDAAKLSEHLNEHFAPEIYWKISEYQEDGKTFGILAVKEANEKPVVCKKGHANELREGDIYYRYSGRSENIKYSELRYILDQKRAEEEKLWMNLLARVAKVGVREAAILDLKKGDVVGPGGTFIIDESLLEKINFIKEGEFDEIKGATALKLIGDLKPIKEMSKVVTKVNTVEVVKQIRTPDIILDFLNSANRSSPQEYVKAICLESSGYLPVHFFMKMANLSVDSTLSIAENVSSRCVGRRVLMERLKNGTRQYSELINTGSSAFHQKYYFVQQIFNHSVDESIADKNLKYCLCAIKGLTAQQVKENENYLKTLLKAFFDRNFTSESAYTIGELKKAICWIDEALYG